ncbi:hypothetical protein [Bifidobacterium pseudocatenulatum]|uniref:hypothetical protein n=1 Tax=Bifidobacterium pseudocatenulatum TaxID=28026 RepID=UPI00080B05A2|nr:hypothetical protein [Bifidobacterium pseudocatenulatum]MCB4867885.1 hypothetical protein [Bifidobacterium pseudocatenulatum]
MRKTTRITLAITVICMALAGCGSASELSTPAHAVRSVDSQCSAGADVFTECIVTLTDTRQVDCVVYSANGNQAGLSCDWYHMSVADKEPTR